MWTDWAEEIIAGAAAVVGGAWTVTKLALKDRANVIARMSNLEHEVAEMKACAVTRQELLDTIKERDQKNERLFERIDMKIDASHRRLDSLLEKMGTQHE